jgi:hypothetical protein
LVFSASSSPTQSRGARQAATSIPGDLPEDADTEDVPLVEDDEGTDLEPLPPSTVDEDVSVQEDDVSLDIGDLPDSLTGEVVSQITISDSDASGLDPFDSPSTEAAPPVVLPWKTSARFPTLAKTVPCTCDPTAETSLLVLTAGTDTSTLALQLIAGGLNDTFVFPIVAGEPEHLTLGRDVLAGRVWVDSTTPKD